MTHTTKHTPGPWFYNYDDRCITNQDGVTVINVHGAMSGDNTNADIAMLAAAPAMYAAIGDLISLFDMRFTNGLTLNQVLPKEVWERVSMVVNTAKQIKTQAEGR